MKYSWLRSIALLLISISSLCIAQTPLWTKEKFPDIDIDRYYFGIGQSKKSQEDADAKARQSFALNVEVKIKSDFEDRIQESNKKYKESSEMTFSQVTDVTLRGINISERYKQKTKKKASNIFKKDEIRHTYYSLILIEKDEYENIIKEEIDRAIKIREKELEEYEAQQKMAQKKEAMDIEHRKKMLMTMKKNEDVAEKEHKQKMKEKANALARKKESIRLLRKQRELYGDFLNELPPHQVIEMFNGELIPTRQELYAKVGVVPFSFDYISYAYRLWLLEFDMSLDMEDNKPNQQELHVRFQLLPNQGEFWKTSVTFGYVESTHSLKNKKFKEIIPDHSPFLAANVTLPNLYHSYVSMYGDFRQISLGINNYLPYRHFSNHLSLLMQLDFIMNDDYRNVYDDPVVFQFGIRFLPMDNIDATLAFENNDTITFSMGVRLEKGIKIGIRNKILPKYQVIT